MKFNCLFWVILTACVSCNDHSIHVKKSNSASEITINQAYQQMVLRNDLPADSMEYYFRSLENMTTDIPQQLAIKNLCRGAYFRKKASFELAISYLNSTLGYLSSNDSLTSEALLGLGICYKHLGDFPKALSYFQKSVQISENNKDKHGLASTFAAMAQMYFEKNDIKRSREFISKVFELYNNHQTGVAYFIALHTLANIEGQSNNFAKALEIDKQGIELAIKYGNDAVKVSFQDNMARCYLYGYQDYEKALYYFNENLKIDKKLNNPNWIADTYINLAEVETARKDFRSAEKSLKQAIDISLQSKQFINISKAYKALSELYKTQGRYDKALSANEAYTKHYQNVINEKSEQAFAQYNLLFETEKKEKEIAETKLKSKQKNIWLILLTGGLLIGMVIYRAQRNKSKHKQHQLLLENRLLQEEAQIQMQQQRLEISRDLHDSLGSQLTLMNTVLDSIKADSRLDEKTNSKIRKLSDFSEDSISELKSVLWVLNTNEIRMKDLKYKLLNLIKNAGEAKEDMQFLLNMNVNENKPLSGKQAINIFRVVQEIVNNAIKYSEAEVIKINLFEENNALCLNISDNGNGFDLETEKSKSFGLNNIQYRIEEIGGFVKISSSGGTTFNIQIPLKS